MEAATFSPMHVNTMKTMVLRRHLVFGFDQPRSACLRRRPTTHPNPDLEWLDLAQGWPQPFAGLEWAEFDRSLFSGTHESATEHPLA
jgi:hypothetical protein